MRKRLFPIFLSVVLCLTLLPANVFATETVKKEISVVRALAIIQTPKFGERMEHPNFQVIEGAPAYFSTTMCGWAPFSQSHTFGEDEYCYRLQIRIDGDDGLNYKFSDNVKVYVNDVEWTIDSAVGNFDTFSYFWVKSPSTKVKAPEGTPLTFEGNTTGLIPDGVAGKAIDGYDFSYYVSGGKKPYTYTIAEGPDWLNVTTDGKFSGTRPDKKCDRTTCVVRVSDYYGTYIDITVQVGRVAVPTDISVIRATSNIVEPKFGANIKMPKFIITEGSPAEFTTTMASWMPGRKTTGTFGDDFYYYTNQIRLDFDDGLDYNFSEDVKVYIDGEEWEVESIDNEDTFSYIWVRSPLYLCSDPTKDDCKVTFDLNGIRTYDPIEPINVEKGGKLTKFKDPVERKYLFDGWYTDKELTKLFDFNSSIESDLYLYAKWRNVERNNWYNLYYGWVYVDAYYNKVSGLKKINDYYYYFDENNENVMVTGWFEIDSVWYYFRSSGEMVTGWSQIGDNWYYFDAEGHMLSGGWKHLGDNWYYFNANGSLKTGWLNIDNVWYYLKDNGVMVTGWQKINNVWYYFNSNGAMKTGWYQEGVVWYYFNANGSMATGWVKINNIWYYFRSSGEMVTSWQKIGGVWYYFENNGSMVSGWKLIGGVWYYFDANGSMVTGSKTINGKTYNFDSNGHCTNP